MKPRPTAEQATALRSIKDFLADKESRYFLLSGYAGTGKTFCMQQLIDDVKGRLIFTAPTNKATKVLRELLTTDDYKPECRTIYSLLGLRLEPNGEVKELTVPEDPVDLSQYKAIVVDEASMTSEKLLHFIRQTADYQSVKFIFLGDPAQLPPVKEIASGVWSIPEAKAELITVMRHDNQILNLATEIRKVVDHPAPTIKLKSDFAQDEGVWALQPNDWHARIVSMAEQGAFSQPTAAKAIAWRNATVDSLNKTIRGYIFADAASTMWLQEDRCILTEPAKDLNDDIVATTDDEGIVTRVSEDEHPAWREFKIWRLSVTTDFNKPIQLYVLHNDSMALYLQTEARLLEAAKLNRRRWPDFWEFREAFHKVRHAYAITAHRSQGSTYDTAFVNWRDILLNRNRQEAYRCLYVACTRPKKRLFLG